MSFFRTLKHLLPDGRAWRLTIDTTLRRFILGLSGTSVIATEEGEPIVTEEDAPLVISRGPFGDAVEFCDDVYEDLDPEKTRELVEWEKQFGLEPNGDEAIRRLALAAEWAANGGQSPSYIQGVLHTAGFTQLFVHEWWEAGAPPYVARDPRDYTTQPLVGTWQCTGAPGAPLPSQPQCSAFPSQPQCNDWLVNDPGYLVNKDLTRRPPPPIPADPDTWPYFLYVGAETFPEIAFVDPDQRALFERLILKIRPAHMWIVYLITFEFYV